MGLQLEHGVLDIGLSDDGVLFEHRPCSPPTDFHDDPLGYTRPTKVAGGGAAKVVEEQAGDFRRRTGVLPLLSKIFDSFTVGPGKHTIVSTLAADAARSAIHRPHWSLRPRGPSPFLVVPGSNLMVRLSRFTCETFHLADFADSPPIGSAYLNHRLEPNV